MTVGNPTMIEGPLAVATIAPICTAVIRGISGHWFDIKNVAVSESKNPEITLAALDAKADFQGTEKIAIRKATIAVHNTQKALPFIKAEIPSINPFITLP